MLQTARLGEEVATVQPAFSPAEHAAITRVIKDELEIQSKQLEIKERKSRRFWGAIGGLAAATTAIITVLAFVHRDRR